MVGVARCQKVKSHNQSFFINWYVFFREAYLIFPTWHTHSLCITQKVLLCWKHRQTWKLQLSLSIAIEIFCSNKSVIQSVFSLCTHWCCLLRANIPVDVFLICVAPVVYQLMFSWLQNNHDEQFNHYHAALVTSDNIKVCNAFVGQFYISKGFEKWASDWMLNRIPRIDTEKVWHCFDDTWAAISHLPITSRKNHNTGEGPETSEAQMGEG